MYTKTVSCLVLAGILTIPMVTHAARLLPGPEVNTEALPSNAVGAKRVAVLLFNYTDNPIQPFSADDVRRQLVTDRNSTDAFLRETSFNSTWLSSYVQPGMGVDVFGWYTIPLVLSSSGRTEDTNFHVPLIDANARGHGFRIENYDVVLYMHPDFGLLQRGNAFGGKRAWLDGLNSVYAAHEILHVLGADHANAIRCTDGGIPVPVGDTVTKLDYGDPFDLMGGGRPRHLNGFFKARLGWLQEANMTTVSFTQGQPYRVRINPLERASNGVMVVRIPVPANRIPLTYGQHTWRPDPTTVPLFYYLEYRQPSYFDAFSPNDKVVNGVTIHLGTNINTNHQTFLVDCSPTTPIVDSSLGPGEVFRDAVAGITIRTVSVSSVDAVVDITLESSILPGIGSHMLWTRTDGTASLWTVDSAANCLRHRYYGPCFGATAVAFERSAPLGGGRMLWTRSDGGANLWRLDGFDNPVSIRRFGPFPSCAARSYQRLPDGTAKMLWSRVDGSAMLFNLDAQDNITFIKTYGPFSQWTARSYQRLPDGTGRLLWSRNDGAATIWTLNSNDDLVRTHQTPAYTNWTATDYERLPNGSARLTWTRNDGLGTVWTLDSNDNWVSNVDRGPFVDWSLEDWSEM